MSISARRTVLRMATPIFCERIKPAFRSTLWWKEIVDGGKPVQASLQLMPSLSISLAIISRRVGSESTYSILKHPSKQTLHIQVIIAGFAVKINFYTGSAFSGQFEYSSPVCLGWNFLKVGFRLRSLGFAFSYDPTGRTTPRQAHRMQHIHQVIIRAGR